MSLVLRPQMLPVRRRPSLFRSVLLAVSTSVALMTGLQQCRKNASPLDGVLRSYPLPR